MLTQPPSAWCVGPMSHMARAKERQMKAKARLNTSPLFYFLYSVILSDSTPIKIQPRTSPRWTDRKDLGVGFKFSLTSSHANHRATTQTTHLIYVHSASNRSYRIITLSKKRDWVHSEHTAVSILKLWIICTEHIVYFRHPVMFSNHANNQCATITYIINVWLQLISDFHINIHVAFSCETDTLFWYEWTSICNDNHTYFKQSYRIITLLKNRLNIRTMHNKANWITFGVST